MNRAKLKGLRVERGFTQEAFAAKIGIPHATYCLKEQGKTEFKESEIARIAEFLKVSPSIFFEE